MCKFSYCLLLFLIICHYTVEAVLKIQTENPKNHTKEKQVSKNSTSERPKQKKILSRPKVVVKPNKNAAKMITPEK